jgi:hypothetical protein
MHNLEFHEMILKMTYSSFSTEVKSGWVKWPVKVPPKTNLKRLVGPFQRCGLQLLGLLVLMLQE